MNNRIAHKVGAILDPLSRGLLANKLLSSEQLRGVIGQLDELSRAQDCPPNLIPPIRNAKKWFDPEQRILSQSQLVKLIGEVANIVAQPMVDGFARQVLLIDTYPYAQAKCLLSRCKLEVQDARGENGLSFSRMIQLTLPSGSNLREVAEAINVISEAQETARFPIEPGVKLEHYDELERAKRPRPAIHESITKRLSERILRETYRFTCTIYVPTEGETPMMQVLPDQKRADLFILALMGGLFRVNQGGYPENNEQVGRGVREDPNDLYGGYVIIGQQTCFPQPGKIVDAVHIGAYGISLINVSTAGLPKKIASAFAPVPWVELLPS